MNRFCLWHRRYLCGSFFILRRDNIHDKLEDDPEFIPETGLQRVYKAFSDKAPGQPSKEMISLSQLVSASGLIGFMVGGMIRGNKAHENFIIANQHTKFITPYEAKRKLQDTIVLYFMKGGISWGIKAALFTGIYCFCVTAIPIYRNSGEGILEYVVGGALAAGLSRLYAGWKASLASATLVGCVAGLIGILTFLSTTSMSELRDFQYSIYEWRQKRVEDEVAKKSINRYGHELPDILGMRERRRQKKETSGYSQNETVFYTMADPDEVTETTEIADNKAKAENETSNEQRNTPTAAGVPTE